MFILKVKDKATGAVQQSDFKTSPERDAWILECESNLVWGPIGSYDLELSQEREKLEAVSPRQIRLALLSLNITESFVDNAINQMPSPDKDMAMIAWKFSTMFNRYLDVVVAIGATLGLNEDKLDQLWKLAASL